MSATDALAAVLADPEAAARGVAAAGGTVVGTLGGAAPVELIAAAGAMPMRLRGDPAAATDRADEWMEPVQEGALRSIFDRLLAGHFAYIDLIVVPRSSEQLLQFYYLVEHVRASEPGIALPALHLLDILQTPAKRTTRYDRARLEEFRAVLSTITDQPPADPALRDAIRRQNEVRRLFQDMTRQRRGTGDAPSGADALALAIAGQVLPADDFCGILRSADELAVPREVPRVMLKGMPQEQPDLTRIIEALGAAIVADDHDWGERLYDRLVEETADPLDGLTLHYQYHAVGPRLLPLDEQHARFASVVDEAQLDGVIFAIEENDDTFGWDYPAEKRMLDEREIPSLLVTGLSYRGANPGAEEHIGGFVHGLSEAQR